MLVTNWHAQSMPRAEEYLEICKSIFGVACCIASCCGVCDDGEASLPFARV